VNIDFNKRLFKMSGVAAYLVVATISASTHANEGVNSEVDVSFRYRIETVDMATFDEDAQASTLRTRATIKTKWNSKWDSVLEFDDVSEIGMNDFNAGQGNENRANYPKIIDPDGTEVNQVFIRYNGESTKAAFGRQRILVGNQRFVGGVGWRQNEQTYDTLTVKRTINDKLNVNYAYVFNVNRITGEAVVSGDHKHNTHLVNADYKLGSGQLSGYFFAIDNETSANASGIPGTSNASNNTFGVRYTAKAGDFVYTTEIASQIDAGDNANDYSATYLLFEGTYKKENYSFGAGYEVLGGDAAGGQGFTTSLATLHKFQGWADVFLATPKEGIKDFNLNGSFKFNGVNIKVIYHNFTTDEGSDNLGTELDIAISKKLTKKLSGLFKFASFDADNVHYASRDKIWLMLSYKL